MGEVEGEEEGASYGEPPEEAQPGGGAGEVGPAWGNLNITFLRYSYFQS